MMNPNSNPADCSEPKSLALPGEAVETTEQAARDGLPDYTRSRDQFEQLRRADTGELVALGKLPSKLELYDSRAEQSETAAPLTADQIRLMRDVEEIEKAIVVLGTDEDALFQALAGKDPVQARELMRLYEDKYHVNLMERLSDGELNDDELARARRLLYEDHPIRPAPDRVEPQSDKTGAQSLEKIAGNQRVRAEHAKLEKLAESKIANPDERREFLENMKRFEEKSASMANEYRKEFEAQGLSPKEATEEAESKAREQVETTYENIGKLLEKSESAPVSESDRVILAEQVMRHAADTKSISQGDHPSCGIATVETRTFQRDPAEASRLVADVATTGKYTSNAKQPVTVDIDAESLQKHGQSKILPTPNGYHDYASQIFRVTAINVHLSIENAKFDPPGQLRYEQREPDAGTTARLADNGARVRDHEQHSSSGEARDVTDIWDRGLATVDIARLSNHITPDGAKDTVILASSQSIGRDQQFCMPGAQPIESEAQLKENLSRLKKEGKLPVVIAVDTGNEPFWSDSGGGTAGGSGGKHVVTVTNYDDATGLARVQNQWGKEDNHQVSAHDLFAATRPPTENLETIEIATAKDKQVDYGKELEELRLQHMVGKVDDQQYEKEIVKLAMDMYGAAKGQPGAFQSREYEENFTKLRLMIEVLPSPTRSAAISREISRRIAIEQGEAE